MLVYVALSCLHVSAPVRRGAEADARLGLACFPIFFFRCLLLESMRELAHHAWCWAWLV